MPILNVNGTSHDVSAPDEMPLLWVLRDLMALRGTKYGCGIGVCGACTVHVDGKAARSCIMTVASVVGKEITTIEGLAADEPHPVQEAWQTLNVPQCGYCQPGQIMSAAALLADNSSPNDEEINSAMSGNICRCGTYPRIRKAIHLAAEKLD